VEQRSGRRVPHLACAVVAARGELAPINLVPGRGFRIRVRVQDTGESLGSRV